MGSSDRLKVSDRHKPIFQTSLGWCNRFRDRRKSEIIHENRIPPSLKFVSLGDTVDVILSL